MGKAVLTIGVGKKLYVDLAVNLARSFVYWHPQSDIKFQLVTDQPQLIPTEVSSYIEVIKVKPGELGTGFSAKLHLDKLVTCQQTLFIDSDCLIFGKLDRLFGLFKGKAVSVVGSYIANGEWFGDVESICKKFNIPQIPKFNGGVYYLEKNDTAKAVYQTARDLEKKYDEIGFIRLRGKPNDEVLMALAMQLNGQQVLTDDGSVLSDPQACPGGYDIDVISGKRSLYNPPAPHPLHQAWYPFETVSPLIVHFLGYYTLHYSYRREVYRLEKALAKNLNPVTEVLAKVNIEYPSRFVNFIKATFRPIYHSLFGYRKIKVSDRI